MTLLKTTDFTPVSSNVIQHQIRLLARASEWNLLTIYATATSLLTVPSGHGLGGAGSSSIYRHVTGVTNAIKLIGSQRVWRASALDAAL